MGKLLSKCLLFLFLLTCLQVGLGYLLKSQRPFYWGHEYLHARMDHLQESTTSYNLLALGSSRIMCHLDPKLLNQLMGLDYPTQSFNCGLAGTFAPATYNFYEKYLESSLKKPRIVILELDWLMQPHAPDMHITDYKYWLGFKDYWFGLTGTWQQPDMRKLHKLPAMYGYSMSYLENIWNIGIFKSLYEVSREGPNAELLGMNKDGFINLEDAVLYASDPQIRKGMAALRDAYLADTTVVSSAKDGAIRAYHEQRAGHPINSVHYKRLQELLDLSNQKGVHLIFLLSPRVYAPDLLALLNRLPAQHKIDLSDPDVFPEFYQAKYSFDKMHLNHKGAVLYTQALSSALKKIISQHNIHNPQ